MAPETFLSLPEAVRQGWVRESLPAFLIKFTNLLSGLPVSGVNTA